MKMRIDSYCFHRLFGEVYEGQPMLDNAMTMDDFLAFAVELGVDGVSLGAVSRRAPVRSPR
jgi:3-oxoisoapionate decarboxylase